MAGAVLVSPFLPMLFMGEEWSEPNPFQYFVSHTDPELAEAVRKGRKAEFAAFHAQGEAPDPVSEGTFKNSMLQWGLMEREPHSTMLRYYKDLIRIRKTHPALRNLDRNQLHVDFQKEPQVVILHRWHKDDHIVCLLNFSKKEQHLRLPSYAERWFRLFDSANPVCGGPKGAPYSAAGARGSDNGVSVQPESILIYSNRNGVDD
jgi:maltooligosyltrehalose trehalohydrolase